MRVFNSLGRQSQIFTPREDGHVTMYVCGPTVQSAPHVGHGRSAVAFDVILQHTPKSTGCTIYTQPNSCVSGFRIFFA